MSPACFCPHQLGRWMADWHDSGPKVSSSYGGGRTRWGLSGVLLVGASWENSEGDRSSRDGVLR